MPREITNTSASVHARLLNVARGSARPFSDLLQVFAMERFLCRLARTPHADRFVLKGAMLMRAWEPLLFRTTMDIDLLARVPNSIATLERIIRDACDIAVEPDGIRFDPTSVQGETIIEDADYSGIRITFVGTLGKARVPMQIDVAFDDVVTPRPTTVELPSILGMQVTPLLAYPPETAVAEKFQVMLFRAESNSRMKDFHDIWWMSAHLPFDGRSLAEAITATCARRRTELPAQPTVLTQQFAASQSKHAQWSTFRGRLVGSSCPTEFEAVMEQLRRFLGPVVAALRSHEKLARAWDPVHGWTDV